MISESLREREHFLHVSQWQHTRKGSDYVILSLYTFETKCTKLKYRMQEVLRFTDQHIHELKMNF